LKRKTKRKLVLYLMPHSTNVIAHGMPLLYRKALQNLHLLQATRITLSRLTAFVICTKSTSLALSFLAPSRPG
jgi:hypothetical protein